MSSLRKTLLGAAAFLALAGPAFAQGPYPGGGGGITVPVTGPNGGTNATNGSAATLNLPNVTETLLGCSPGPCTYTTPATTDTILGLTSTPTLTHLWTFNANIGIEDAGWLSTATNSLDEKLILDGAVTAGQGYFMGLVQGANGHGSDTNYALLSLGANTLGGSTAASGVLGGATYDQTMFQSSTAGWYGFRCNPTLSSVGSGIQHCFDIGSAGLTWNVDINGVQDFAGASSALRLGGSAAAFNKTPTCSAAGGSPTCTVNAHSGTLAFKATLGAASAVTTLTITPGATAANGWICVANDNTTSTERLFQNTALSATTATLTFFSAVGIATPPGATDVISGECVAM